MNVMKRVDKNLLRRILGASKSTLIPALYLETFIISLTNQKIHSSLKCSMTKFKNPLIMTGFQLLKKI